MTSLCEVPRCDRPVQDATICGACTGQLEDALRTITGHQGEHTWVTPIGDDLEIALMRLSKLGGSGRRTGAAPLLFDPRASDASHALRNTLVTWVRLLADDLGPLPDNRLDAIAAWLLDRTERIRHHPAAGEAVRDITGAVQHALRIVDRPPERWYAGICGADLRDHDWCREDLYAPVKAAVIQCPACGNVWDVQARRDWLLRQAEDVLAHAALIAQALSALGTPVTPVMITRWVTAGRLLDHGRDGAGRTLYRLGDVITLAHEHAQRQAVRTARKAEAV